MKVFLIFTISLTSIMIQAQSDYKANFLKKWDNAASYTIECAEAMPEDKYDFKPSPESRTFKDQLLHMVGNMMWLSTDYLEGVPYRENLKEIDPNKMQMVTLLRETFKLSRQAVEKLPNHKLRDVVEFFAGPMEIQQIMMLMTDHMTHHRGQILVYMRMNDVKAPKYRGW